MPVLPKARFISQSRLRACTPANMFNINSYSAGIVPTFFRANSSPQQMAVVTGHRMER